MKFIIAIPATFGVPADQKARSEKQFAEKVPGAHQEEVEFFCGSTTPYRKETVWVAELTSEQLAIVCGRSGGHIAIEDRSVKECVTNSIGAFDLITW